MPPVWRTGVGLGNNEDPSTVLVKDGVRGDKVACVHD